MVKKNLKICVVTGSRSEFGLLSSLINLIKDSPFFNLQLIATGSHLSPEHGLTISEIESQGLKVDYKLEMLMSSDTPTGTVKSMGLALIGITEAFNNLKPDMIVILGDRYEMLSIAQSALVYSIPIIHIHGGELTEGAYDDAIRHSITKMSSLHFVSTEIYRKRVIQLGERPEKTFNVGALCIDSINNKTLFNKKELEENLSINLLKKNIIITYHPTTKSLEDDKNTLNSIFKLIKIFPEFLFLFTMPNADDSSRELKGMIDIFSKSEKNVFSYNSIGQKNYLSCLSHFDLVLGNSSSGIIEAPFFNIPTVNIGDRQLGRICGETIINSTSNFDSILKSFRTALSQDFVNKKKNTINPYFSRNKSPSKEIIKILENLDYEFILEKRFYDIEFNY